MAICPPGGANYSESKLSHSRAAAPQGWRWSVWILLIGMPGVPIAIALLRDLTLAERHLLFSIPFFMAYWGAGLDRCGDRLAAGWRPRRSGSPERESSQIG